MYTRHRLATSLAATLALACAASAHAIEVTYNFSGKVAMLPPPMSAHIVTDGFASLGIGEGDAITGSFTYETVAADTSPTAEIGFFANTLRAFSVTIEGHTWSLVQAPNTNYVQVDNDWQIPAYVPVTGGSYSDRLTITTTALSGPAPSTLGAQPLDSTSLELVFSALSATPSDTPFSSTNAPESLALAHFTELHQGYITYTFFDASNRYRSELIRFGIDSLSPAAPVPEPSTIASMVGGLGVLAAWRARRRNR
jgi:hypothetical protein